MEPSESEWGRLQERVSRLAVQQETMRDQLLALSAERAAQKELLTINTTMTAEIAIELKKQATESSELIQLLKDTKGAWRLLELLGKAALPLAKITAVLAVFAGAWKAAAHYLSKWW